MTVPACARAEISRIRALSARRSQLFGVPLEDHLGRRHRQAAVVVVGEVLIRPHPVGDGEVMVIGPDRDSVKPGIGGRVDDGSDAPRADRSTMRGERRGREYERWLTFGHRRSGQSA